MRGSGTGFLSGPWPPAAVEQLPWPGVVGGHLKLAWTVGTLVVLVVPALRGLFTPRETPQPQTYSLSAETA